LETLEEDAPVEDAAPTLKKLVKRLRKMVSKDISDFCFCWNE
jgi:hypothetical protein